MVSWLVIIVIASLVIGLGSALVLLFLPVRAWLTVEGVYASITLGVVLGGWLAMVLAEWDLFR